MYIISAAQINLRKSIEDPYFDAQTNIMGSLNILNETKRIGAKIIFSSTGGAIYSPLESLPLTENSITDPQSPYGLNKLTIEKYIELYHNLYGLEYCVLRFSNVFGSRQNAQGEAGVLSIFTDKMINEPITIFGTGEQDRDFIYIKDLIQACYLALNLKGIFNVSTNQQTTVNTIAQLLKEKFNSTSNIQYAPAIKGEILNSCLSYDKLNTATSWKPQYTLKDGIQDMLQDICRAEKFNSSNINLKQQGKSNNEPSNPRTRILQTSNKLYF